MKACSAIVHVSPALGAKFTQYTAEFEVGGELGSTPAQRFIFVIEGKVKLEVDGKSSELGARGYAYLPARIASSSSGHETRAVSPSSRNTIRLSIRSSLRI